MSISINHIKKSSKKLSNSYILKKDLFYNNLFQLEKALNSTINLKSNLKIYSPNDINKKFSKPIQLLRKRIKSCQRRKTEKSKLQLLNESIISIFHNADNSLDKSMQLFNQTKKENDLFLAKLKYLQRIREKISRKKNNSATLKPIDFSIFGDLTNKYRKKNILITNQMFKNKDLYKSTPLLLKNKREMEFFYLFNHDKYSNKTNRNSMDSSFNIKSNNIQIKFNNEKKINFQKLKQSNFFKKLIASSNKRIKELSKESSKKEKKEGNNNEFKYEVNKDYNETIQKDKEEIFKLIKNIELLNNSKNKEDKKNDKCQCRLSKKCNGNNDISFSFDSFYTISKRTNFPHKNSFCFINNKSNPFKYDKNNKSIKKIVFLKNFINKKNKNS